MRTGINQYKAGNPYWKGMISTVDLLVLTGLDLLLLFKQTLFSFDLHKATKWGGKLYCTGPSPSVSVPWYRYSKLRYICTDRIYGSKNSATLAKGFQALSQWATYNPVSYHLAQGTKALHLIRSNCVNCVWLTMP